MISIRSLALAIMLTTVLSLAAASISEEEARIWCDNNSINAIEGIWEYPEDNARVLIQADKEVPGTFSITLLSSPDCRLMPGDIIGRFYPSADPRQFRLVQTTKRDQLSLVKPQDCMAILSTDGESIRVKTKKLKLRINPSILLPKFWRVVRFSVDNPVDDLPAGLVKVYPGYDNNGSLRRKIRIL